ncbi:MAG: sulfate adenylyltransferase [Moraxellaceae bacterium]|nr:MAG: sulfate adenylyltransferase [Moraxellaceae bacterium]
MRTAARRSLGSGLLHNYNCSIWVFILWLVVGGVNATAQQGQNAKDWVIDIETLEHFQRQYGEAAAERILSWQYLLNQLDKKPEMEVLEEVNRFFNQVRFLSDDIHWQQLDYWATPLELLATNGGDCEDFAIAKYFSLKWLGVPVNKMRLTYVKAIELNQAHMVLTYHESLGDEPIVLDNLIDDILPASQRSDLTPVYSFNGDGLWNAKRKGKGSRLGDADDIVLWKELRSRIEWGR